MDVYLFKDFREYLFIHQTQTYTIHAYITYEYAYVLHLFKLI